MRPPPPCSTLFPYTTLFRSQDPAVTALSVMGVVSELKSDTRQVIVTTAAGSQVTVTLSDRTVFMRIPPGEKSKDKRSEEHTSELQSRRDLVCRLLLEKKKKK